MRYQVDPALLLRESGEVAGAALALGQARLPELLGVLREAVPGGSTAAAVNGIQSSWRTELDNLRSQVRSLGDSLDAAAAGYEQVETVATQALGVAR